MNLDKNQTCNIMIEVIKFVKLATFKGGSSRISKKLEKLVKQKSYTKSLTESLAELWDGFEAEAGQRRAKQERLICSKIPGLILGWIELVPKSMARFWEGFLSEITAAICST